MQFNAQDGTLRVFLRGRPIVHHTPEGYDPDHKVRTLLKLILFINKNILNKIKIKRFRDLYQKQRWTFPGFMAIEERIAGNSL